MNDGWICEKCGVLLAPKKTLFSYMNMTFAHEALQCPRCGAVLVSKEMADGKMAEVEQMMEDK